MKNRNIREEMNKNLLSNPAGNIMEELSAADLNQVSGAGDQVARTSNGTLCSVTIECSVVLWTAICCV